MQKSKILILGCLSSLVIVTGCTSIDVSPVSNNTNITHICIEENENVKVSDIVYVIQNRLNYHNISSELVKKDTAKQCEYTMLYSALKSWDFKPYLSHANFEIYQGNRVVSKGVFHLNLKGGLTFSKYGDTASKINPVIDQMLNKL